MILCCSSALGCVLCQCLALRSDLQFQTSSLSKRARSSYEVFEGARDSKSCYVSPYFCASHASGILTLRDPPTPPPVVHFTSDNLY
jgi:hypothetical protein